MCAGAAFGSITAEHLPRDDGWSERVFGAPVGRVDRIGFKKKSEDRWEFDGKMGRKSAGHSGRARTIDDGVELILEMSARNRDAACGDASVLILGADPQGVLEDPLHAGREVAFPMTGSECNSGAMRQTRLMNRLFEAPIGRPAVAHQDTAKSAPSRVAASANPRPG